ncbi:thioredoxin [Lachnospiraceae bacterium ASD4241]|uniref:Thioredoxin n=1 Tax=Diplocloster modestus TaxID=2850322 RepID=A0ABS6K4U5_9FIRM|nr:thioredoxin [Diplocloster modestus]MBU9725555.1 thioredoxin [Diplocloster modestus]
MALTFNDENFEQEVLKSEIPVLVDFYADWCGPCKMMGPVVEKLADAYSGKVKVGKLNVDNSMETAGKYRVMSIPTFIIFKDGQAVDTIQGAVPKEMIESKLNAL